MRNISSENQAALSQRLLVARDFLWLVARDAAGAPFQYGFWSGVGDVSAPMLNPDTGLAVTRNFEGSGTLIQVSDIIATSSISTQNVTVEMSQILPEVENIVRGYDLQQARVEVYRGLFSTETRQLAALALCRFVGFVDSVDIHTPEEGGEGSITLTCVSHTQEMSRSNPDTRSDASQRLRNASDNFFQDVATVGETEFFWGRKSGKIASVKAAPPTPTNLQKTVSR
ncbi:hypothetical protein [Limoniibacter endophyticus]|uniref:Uncharacterized protein n=1 Tax=Limoniibacter endophyticus TaxID=1565040 RepID=A0A8J3DFL9_9HYPH|nr:hypothetical protein [Limoniibacter endophyticus]GHC61660.1 hypothetical protein GCM10010136_02340 [Limoniibacter endophyticus]